MFDFEITMDTVESTNIEKAGYDAEKRVMEVQFKNGSRYRYKDVPLETWNEFNQSSSKGVYVAQVMRKKYEAVKFIAC